MTNYGPWIGWNGGECPVADGVVLQVQQRDETRVTAQNACTSKWRHYTWETVGAGSDIIAYREVIEPEVIVWDGLWDSGRKAIIGRGMCSAGLPRGVRITIQGDSIKAEWVE